MNRHDTFDLAASAEAQEIVRDATVCDITLPWGNYGNPKLRAATLPRMIASGYNFVSLTLATDEQSLSNVVAAIASQRAFFHRSPNKYAVIETVGDIWRAKNDNKLAISFHFQGTNALERNIDMVDVYYRLGVRHMLMAYNQKNAVGDGCHERTDAGLSRFGIELVEEMNRVGMLVDCSHTGYKTSMNVLEISTAPVIFSHSNACGVREHRRNIKDDQIIACAKTGGLVGINGVNLFLSENGDAATEMARHVDYVIQLVGPAHIGLGLDYIYDVETLMHDLKEPTAMYPDEGGYRAQISFAPPELLPQLVDELLKLGYADDVIKGVLGENFLRVAGQVWRASPQVS